jgi:hypothetical protein
MFVMDDPFSARKYQFTNMAGEFIQLRDHLIQLGLTEKNKSPWMECWAGAQYQPLHARLVDRITHEQTDGIREEILNHDLLRQRDMLDRLDKMVDMERSESRAAAVQASDEYRSAYLVMMFLTAAAIAFGLLIAGYVVRRARLIESALAQEKEHAEITPFRGRCRDRRRRARQGELPQPAAEQMTGWRSEEARASR